ncbi:hypothetical protein I7007_001286 [Campylobacter jejuni]|nr:hypothetical protein [Campylobacter jejuni]EAJ2975631.1 hypothetical protein [Campylobacter jejuni]EDP2897568.1 hypothetical protein [Campylobacter jejuni]EGR9265303.1 hypothetical protein [Campylobacter jejuni]QDQ36503.1 hypothetical protein E5V15_09455 [Campylobacter jejuni]
MSNNEKEQLLNQEQSYDEADIYAQEYGDNSEFKEQNNFQEEQKIVENASILKDKKANKKEKKLDYEIKESLSFKCEQFFGKNWKYVFFFVCFCLIVMTWQINSMNSSISDLKQVVADNNGKVVLTTTDGRAIRVIKEPIKAEYLKQFAVSTIVNNFVISRAQLTNNFTKPNFKDYNDVLQTVPSLKTLFVNFIDTKDKQSVGDFRAYLQWLISAVAQDKLPEYISIKDYSVDKYEYNQNTFNMTVSIKVISQNYIIALNEYSNNQGVITVTAKGSFDLQRASDTNPYGLRIKELSINPVTKPKVQ